MKGSPIAALPANIQLKQRIRNLNNKGISKGFSTKYLETWVADMIKENEPLKGYSEKLSGVATREGFDLIRSEDNILSKIQEPKGVVDGLKDFYGVSFTYDI